MERAFVEAVLVLFLYRQDLQEPSFRTTNNQIKEVMRARHPELKPRRKTFEDMKRRYITRPGKPATRFELLRETFKGNKKSSQLAGRPSEYEITGLAVLLACGE